MPPAPVARSRETRLAPARGAMSPAFAPPAPAKHVEGSRTPMGPTWKGERGPAQNPENLVREQERGGRRAMGGTAPLGFAEPADRPGRVQSVRLTTRPGKRRRINALRRSFQHRLSNMRDQHPGKRRKSAIPHRAARGLVADLDRHRQARRSPHPPPKLSPPTPSKQAQISTGRAGTCVSTPYFIGFQ